MFILQAMRTAAKKMHDQGISKLKQVQALILYHNLNGRKLPKNVARGLTKSALCAAHIYRVVPELPGHKLLKYYLCSGAIVIRLSAAAAVERD
jgi:hypothetical protein